MCAYNRIDGQPACASDLLLKEHLRGAWGFKGYVVSDCDAVKDIADNHKYAPDRRRRGRRGDARPASTTSATAQTLGDTAGLGDRYREALQRGLITDGDIDRALVRLFSARYRNGDLPGLRGATPRRCRSARSARRSISALALTAAERKPGAAEERRRAAAASRA